MYQGRRFSRIVGELRNFQRYRHPQGKLKMFFFLLLFTNTNYDEVTICFNVCSFNLFLLEQSRATRGEFANLFFFITSLIEFSWILYTEILIHLKFIMIDQNFQSNCQVRFGRQGSVKKNRYHRFDLPRFFRLICVGHILLVIHNSSFTLEHLNITSFILLSAKCMLTITS